jgi:hypothetical protein
LLISQKEYSKVYRSIYGTYGIIIIAKKIQNGLTGAISWGLSYVQTEVIPMGYRKVSYAEQIWYIVRYKLQQLLRKEDKRAK